ncbi:hypothetical protein Tsubulata_034993 [Turnera subulata]|uniref:Uncharacterized protein n=1 Tax=Turnera subulata TaxID=218843 RepID=A0A9Q0G4L9_9ROSI|nr:hypothetical protein Tsubulata_034993 [Turnera subulata]
MVQKRKSHVVFCVVPKQDIAQGIDSIRTSRRQVIYRKGNIQSAPQMACSEICIKLDITLEKRDNTCGCDLIHHSSCKRRR